MKMLKPITPVKTRSLTGVIFQESCDLGINLKSVTMKKIIIATAVLGGFLIAGCAKDTTYTIKDVPIVITKTVSFAKDINPLFTANCALSGCHATGGHVPNLMADKSYASLTKDAAFVNVKNPSSSILYERLTGVLSPSMPMGKTTNPSNINNLVLAWIKQGAKNN
jgi:hypothetical protein